MIGKFDPYSWVKTSVFAELASENIQNDSQNVNRIQPNLEGRKDFASKKSGATIL